MKKTNFLWLAILFVAGCTKKIESANVPLASNNVPLSSILVDRNFNWSATKQFNISVTGLRTKNTIKGTFSVIDVKTGTTFYKGLHTMSDNLSLKLTIPTATDSLQIRFGSIQKNYSASGTSVQTNYLSTLSNK
ncbi:MAG: hypothetical protein WCP74_12115 [Sphingobacteriia bacterium]|jgi:glucose dehydrogenase